jgi:hypothetical protein
MEKFDLQEFGPDGWTHVGYGTLAELNELHSEMQRTKVVRIRLVSTGS